MGSETYHEPLELLSEPTKNLHRAIISLIEELEAVDWYNQRAEACSDDALKAVLLHHRNEEIEHAMMNLEWIRRNQGTFDGHMRTYLFKTAPITEIEEADTGGGEEGGGRGAEAGAGADKDGDRAPVIAGGPLGIGSLRQG